MFYQFQPGSRSIMTRPEPREVSTSYTSIILNYVANVHPEIDLDLLVSRISEHNEYFIRPAPGKIPEQVCLRHLTNPRLWISNRLVADITSSLEALIDDPMLGYKVGRWSPNCGAFVKNSLLVPFLGVGPVLGRAPEIHEKYTRIKKVEILINKPGWLRIRKTHKPEAIITYFMILSWIGMAEAYVELAGVASPKVSVEVDPRENNAYFLDIKYTRTRLTARFRNRLAWWLLPAHTRESLIATDQIVSEEYDYAVTEEKMEDMLELQRSGIAAYYAHKIEDILSIINKK